MLLHVQAAKRTISSSLFQGCRYPHCDIIAPDRSVPSDVSFLGFAMGGPRFLHFSFIPNRTQKETVVHIDN